MSDNKKKTGGADRRLVAGGQDYEVDYLAKQIHSQVPDKSRTEVEAAIKKAAAVPQFHNDRKMVKNAALGILGKTPW
jgi:hypothetical protein